MEQHIFLLRLREDLQGEILLGDMEECKISLFNLVATGYATPYLHNNILYYNKKGESLVKMNFTFLF